MSESSAMTPAMAYGRSSFQFQPRVAHFIGTQILACLITVVTLGICYPFAVVLVERWKAKSSTIDGRPLEFTASAVALLGRWIVWMLLTIVTLGIYSFWWIPKMYQWRWEHLQFAD